MDQYLGLFKNPPWDFALLMTLAAGGFFWGATYGKKALGFIIVNLYIMYAVWPFIPADLITSGKEGLELWSYKAGIFTLLLILLMLFMSRTFSWGGKDGAWWEVLILAVLISGFYMSIILSFAGADNSFLFLNPLVAHYFTSPEFVRWWTVLPIIGALFV